MVRLIAAIDELNLLIHFMGAKSIVVFNAYVHLVGDEGAVSS
jgi:hypothetical protein